jgi:ElaB/YqjD/DUF883 family membrane-anchored ribosome-binding protein
MNEEGVSAMAQDYDSSSGHTGDATAQIARLREQVETLMRDRVSPAVAAAADRAQSAMHVAADTTREQVEVLSGKVREQPLLAIGIAVAVGYVLGRVTR